MLWCALHSALISPAFTRFFRTHLGHGYRFYRFGYAMFSTITLAGLIHLSHRADPSILFAWTGRLRLIPFAGLGLAALLFAAGARQYDWRELLGIPQMMRGDLPHSPAPGEGLATSGILGMVRHPWYTACFPLIWARDLTSLSIQVNVVLTVYVVVGTLLEERKLLLEHGDAYRDYQRRVSMFVPWKWLRARLRRPSAA
jgi:protein-S-isoprenylcysteine O-methyltransferase Ste14